MIGDGCNPDVIVINSLIDTLYKDGLSKEAWNMFRKMNEFKLVPTVVTYNTLLAGLRNDSRVQERFKLFESMKECGCPPNTKTFNIASMLYEMTEIGCFPDLFTYNTLIYGLVKVSRFFEAFWLFHRMRKTVNPDCITLYTLLPGAVKAGSIEDAFKVVEEHAISFAERVVSLGLRKNGSIMVLVIKLLSKKKKSLDAHKLFEKFTKFFGIRPTLEVYYHLINELLDIHLAELAWDVYKEMKNAGCAADSQYDVYTYNLLLDDLGNSGKVNELFEIYNEMLHRGIEPDKITHSILISGLVKSNKVEKALDLYYDLISGGFSPTPCTYGPLIDGFLKLKELDEAKSLFEEMIEYECKPHCAIYNILINGYGKAGDINTARDLFDIMVNEVIRLDLKSYAILVDCCCLMGKNCRLTGSFLKWFLRFYQKMY
ncbi:hypothetical protein ACJIZ3_005742 [Penstemon smallii]|uniref:Pentatricopeptide repeat-containing protein n=1 Tax=Penstemon smallii TaxID=265156 RepID=A0ABD3S5V8_9LAMI